MAKLMRDDIKNFIPETHARSKPSFRVLANLLAEFSKISFSEKVCIQNNSGVGVG